MDKRTNKLFAVLFCLTVLITCGLSYRIKQLNEEVSAATQLADNAAKEAFGDCQRIMSIQAAMAYYNGCYTAVEGMCGGQSKCMETYRPFCEAGD